MDWDNARIFLAIYRKGTLRSAAAFLDIDQATVGRRLNALEASLGARLFLRTPSGYLATPAGELAVTAAELMERAALQFQREMQGIDNRLSGTVRVATSDTIASHSVLGAMQRLHVMHPEIRVVLSTSTEISNLTRREAELAVRTLKPTSPDLISRHLARRSMGLYATPAYLSQRGMPVPGNGMQGHDIIVYQGSVAPRHKEKLCLEPIANARVAIEVNSGMVMLDAARRGMGVAELPCHMADGDPQLTRVWPERVDHYEVWLVMHTDLSRSARVRATADAIIATFAEEE
ncbi:LysR family transcriptional regulator [Duganella sp. HH101]|uniref:LysR family transcriptional regulator n=1 Tax=Duganella sp. HH101 TaxID=1781066 RepID=UPI0008745298|nr:LysR family transcriptional regulator [Duganella sp. HH101]OFA05157.1 HTH-type transcriptional regulator DmlR [Duganella sp. HH101]